MATNLASISFPYWMTDNARQNGKKMTPDWLVQGTLTKIGDIFDRLTGRGWKPGSSLATSELIERLKTLLDAEVREDSSGRKFVPHNIKLKMQWNKFSTDEESSLKALENEMLIAVVDHINDRRYFTYSPLAIEVKPDYFTEGVKLFASFDKLAGDDQESEIHVSVPGDAVSDDVEQEPSKNGTDEPVLPSERKIRIRFSASDKPFEKVISLVKGKRLSIGRTKENDIAIDDISISKYHAAIVLDPEGKVVVADTGSTNGTFVGGERIAYGKAVEVISGKEMAFGAVRVMIDIAKTPEPTEPAPVKRQSETKTEVYRVGDFQFAKKKTETVTPAAQPDIAKTEAAIEIAEIPEVSKDTPTQMPATQPAIDLEQAEEDR